MRSLGTLIVVSAVSLFHGASIYAQDYAPSPSETNDSLIDTITVTGKANWAGHDGMDAFLAGDFETAEVIFEREFISLKRADNGRYNAAVDAALSISRSNNLSQATTNSTSITGGNNAVGVAANQSTTNPNLAGNSSNKRKKGRNILNDGILSPQDFAFTKYMSGLSEVKLGKYEEAKKSFKTSLFHDSGNADGHMRLGLLYLLDGDIEKSAEQLEKLEKQRVKCKKTDCDEYNEILTSASVLAGQITKEIRKN